MRNVKADFPIFVTYPELVYLDSAATSQKPKQVTEAVNEWYTRYNSNVHRGIYDLAEKATDMYEGVRKKAAGFVGAADPSEIVFTGGTTEGVNLVVRGWGEKFLRQGDIVVLSEAEHHSNLVPWLMLKEEIGIKIFYIPINRKWEMEYEKILDLPKNKIKLVTITAASNVLGTVNNIGELANWLTSKRIKAKVLVDGAQYVPHLPTDVREMGCDFLVWSGHKMLGPSGIGGLWARRELLEEMEPVMTGGHMISEVTKDRVTWGPVPDRFEAGTGKLEAAAGMGAAIDYLHELGWKNITGYEEKLTEYALDKITRIAGIQVVGKTDAKNRLGVISFNLNGVHAHDTAEVLNRYQVCVRAGHHCAQPLLESRGVQATVRASLYIYNTKEDVDRLAEGLAQAGKIFGK